MKTKLKETKTTKSAKSAPVPVAIEKPESKTQQIITLLSKPEGVSLANIQQATGWQRHSVHGFISGSLKKKMGLRIESSKEGKERRYKIASNK